MEYVVITMLWLASHVPVETPQLALALALQKRYLETLA